MNPQGNPFYPNFISPEPPQPNFIQTNEIRLPLPAGIFPQETNLHNPNEPAIASIPRDPVLSFDLKMKSKRRTKNDIEGRDHICGCGKTYLSYPALYTHIKTKHKGVAPDGTQTHQASRGRGRPKKDFINPLAPLQEKERINALKPESELYAEKSNISLDELLKKYGVAENNSKTSVELYDDFLKQNTGDQNSRYYDLFDCLKKVYEEQASIIVQEENPPLLPPIRGEKTYKNCKFILAEYLNEMAKKVNDRFFTTLIIITRLYKECMNDVGWECINKYRPVSLAERTSEFCQECTAEHIPDASNFFLNHFLLKEYPHFDQTIAADLTFHLCEWLHQKGLSHTKLHPL